METKFLKGEPNMIFRSKTAAAGLLVCCLAAAFAVHGDNPQSSSAPVQSAQDIEDLPVLAQIRTVYPFSSDIADPNLPINTREEKTDDEKKTEDSKNRAEDQDSPVPDSSDSADSAGDEADAPRTAADREETETQEMPAVQSETEDAGQVDDGIWHITYVNSYMSSSAPADGSIGLWADGWFIVHNYTPNGEMLQSEPEMIELDGRIYRLSDTWVSGDGLSQEEVARIRANNGVTFQTCLSDSTNLMVHYNPVGDGYPYQFESYPYTVNDGEGIGYYR